MTEQHGHHLILGELSDFLTGEVLPDTHDERYRQKLARLLIDRKGYLKAEVEPRCELRVSAGDKSAKVKVDFLVRVAGRVGMMIKYGPGSLVTRRRSALAASRLLAPYQIPVVVVTNGEDAEVLEGADGAIASLGLESIPDRSELLRKTSEMAPDPIPEERVVMESRIVYAFEVDDSCPCDETVCRL